MKAVTWCGKKNMRVDRVDDPKILNPRDAILRITTTAICGSDLHLYDGVIPTMREGDIVGHEFMGEVVELGSEVKNLQKGDRVIVPFAIACGNCWYCKHEYYSACDNSNPDPAKTRMLYGQTPAGLFGYSHLFGGYAGGQAEYVRVPFADVGPLKIPDGLDDERVVFLTDIFPTGYQAAENCNIQDGDTIAVWGCGPVGQFAIFSAFMLGAGRVIAIDDVPERLAMAKRGGAETINFDDDAVYEELMDRTNGMGPDACIDAVGLEAHGGIDTIYDRIKVATFMATDHGRVLRQAIMCCRKAGTISVPGVYGGIIDKFPFGAAFNKALTFKMGQTHVHKYTKRLLDKIVQEDVDPSFVITHRFPLEQAPEAYKLFSNQRDGCIKVILKP